MYMQQPSKNWLICIHRIFIGHHKSWKGYITGSLAQSGQINFHSPRVFDFRSLDFKDSNSKFWRRWLLRLLWSFSKSPFLRFLNVTKIRNEELETWDLAKTKLKVQNNPGNHFKWPHKIQKWTWPHKRTKLSSPKIIKNQNLTSEYRQLISSEIIICMIFCIRSLVQRSFVQDRWVNDRRFSIRPAYYDDRIFKCFKRFFQNVFSKYCNYCKIKNDKMTFSPSESLFSKCHPSK